MTKSRSWRVAIVGLSMLSLAALGCQPPVSRPASMPPAYTSNQITDPALQKIAEEIHSWASRRPGAGEKPLYSRVEVLPPVPIVQPYGVGVFQEEMRLSVILTTGPGWGGMKLIQKEAAVVDAFRHISEQLLTLNHEPPLEPTLTIQTPQGMELTWINRLVPNGKYVHGDE